MGQRPAKLPPSVRQSRTDALLAVAVAVVRADDESLVPPQAAGLALSVARPLPTETALLGFGGSPVGGGDKSSRFAFFGTSMWGWYHYPRRALHAVETLDAQELRRRIRRFYAAPEFAPYGQNIPTSGTHATPVPNRAHSGSHGETRGVFIVCGSGRVDSRWRRCCHNRRRGSFAVCQ